MQFLQCLETALISSGGKLEPPLESNANAESKDKNKKEMDKDNQSEEVNKDSLAVKARRMIPMLRRRKEVKL